MFGLVIDIGLKFYSALSLPRIWPIGQGHRLESFLCPHWMFWLKSLKEPYLLNLWMDSFDTCIAVRYWSKVVQIATTFLLSEWEVKVMDFRNLEFCWSTLMATYCSIMLGIDVIYILDLMLDTGLRFSKIPTPPHLVIKKSRSLI